MQRRDGRAEARARCFPLRWLRTLLCAVTLMTGGIVTVGAGVAQAAATVEPATFVSGNGGAAGTSTWTVTWSPKTTIVAANPAITIVFPSGIYPNSTTVAASASFAADSCHPFTAVSGQLVRIAFAPGGTCSIPADSALAVTLSDITATDGAYPGAGFTVTDEVDAGAYVYEPGTAVNVVTQTAVPTVVASVASPPSVLGYGNGVEGSAITLTVAGNTLGTDRITFDLPCEPAPGSAAFVSATATSSTTGPLTVLTPTPSGACGGTIADELSIVPNPYDGTQTITVTPTYDLTDVSDGSLSLAGQYAATNGADTITVSDLTVSNVVATRTLPSPPVSPGTGDASIGDLTVTVPSTSAVPKGNDLCLTLEPTSGSPASPAPTFDLIAGASSVLVQQINGSATGAAFVAGSTSQSITAASATPTPSAAPHQTIAFPVATLGSGNPPAYELSKLHVDVPSSELPGTVTVTVGWAASAAACGGGGTVLTSGLPAFVVGTAPGAAIAGPTAEATAAAEYEAAFFNAANAVCSNSGDAVLATAADPYDALAAAYLEGQLHTGVLITPPSATGAIDPHVLAALKEAGVQRVYVVGGPMAVTPQELATLRSTAAYRCGGLSATGGDLRVIPAATTGQTAADTAQLIDEYVSGNGEGQLPTSIAPAFSAASSYDQTTGNASGAAPAVVNGTAIVVAENDWQDAVAAAPIAWRYRLPIVLTPAGTLGVQARAELVRLGYDQVLAVGGPLALSPAVVASIQGMGVTVDGKATPVSVLRIAGADASGTTVDLARFEGAVLGWPNTTLYVAQGTSPYDGWADALAAAGLAAGNAAAGTASPGGILLTAGPSAALPGDLTSALTVAGTPAHGLGGGVTTGIQVLGGSLAVTTDQIAQMKAALAGG